MTERRCELCGEKMRGPRPIERYGDGYAHSDCGADKRIADREAAPIIDVEIKINAVEFMAAMGEIELALIRNDPKAAQVIAATKRRELRERLGA